jgi:3-methylcrotonyl-CoA carboxylase alpha subunit
MPELVHNGERIRFTVDSTPQGATLNLGESRHELTIHEHGAGRFIIRNQRNSFAARVVLEKDRIWVWLAGRVVEFTTPGAEETAVAQRAHERDDVRAPMPGTLVKLLVAAGDAVEKDQVVAVVEAMKMEHLLRAPRSGVVANTFGAPGGIVDADAVVVSLTVEE